MGHVFISYCQGKADDAAFKERVREVADRLRGAGVDAQLDQYLTAPPANWPDAWIEYQGKLSKEQFGRLIAVYEEEFKELPHPILGAKNMHAAIG